MIAETIWFACDCGRNFVEHHAPGVTPSGKCPDCAATAGRRTISEAAAEISAAAQKPTPAPRSKRRASVAPDKERA